MTGDEAEGPDPAALAALAGRDRAPGGWDLALAAFGVALAGAEPPPGLLDRIEGALDAEAAPGTLTLRRDGGTWHEIAPGVSVRYLKGGPGIADSTLLVRCAPGATIPDHDHGTDEESLVVEGDVSIGPLRLVAGDYHAAPRTSTHLGVRTTGGCLLLVIRRAA